MGGWVGGCMRYCAVHMKVEENEGVGMSCLYKWVGGWVGGWVIYLDLEFVGDSNRGLIPIPRDVDDRDDFIRHYLFGVGGWVGG